ncbi:hypothetical protein CF15_02070 [Pyrodictium occultum]|uniref:Lysine transporter LysE n=1 Tax=Pyrodictium occultum TaxID=2309 RepID=A0A0V8RU90_PYROC|nr:LysE family transporter [Pyrodictium occultum]KSW11637.1 hypothetical protein CF15_02070 [Pyrodictium occultum]
MDSVAREQGVRGLVLRTLALTPSGALSPGPLSASAVAVGALLGPLGGVLVALGHMLFELPYVALLVKWAERFEGVLRRLEKPLDVAVAAFIAYFAYGLFQSAAAALHGAGMEGAGVAVGGGALGAIATGLALTGLNPYFLAWWVTVALPLVRGAAAHGAKGFAAMYLGHVWMDYAWLALLAAAGAGLSRMTGLYAALLAGLGVLLLAFAADMLARSLAGRRLLPF